MWGQGRAVSDSTLQEFTALEALDSVFPGFDEGDTWAWSYLALVNNNILGYSLPRSWVSWSLSLGTISLEDAIYSIQKVWA